MNFDTRELSIDMYEICHNTTKTCTTCEKEMWMCMFLKKNFIRDYDPSTLTRVYKTCQHCRDKSYASYMKKRYNIKPLPKPVWVLHV